MLTFLAGAAIGAAITALLILTHKRRANVVVTANSIGELRQLFRAIEDGEYQAVAERLKGREN